MSTTPDKKFAELIPHISDRSELYPYFGATIPLPVPLLHSWERG